MSFIDTTLPTIFVTGVSLLMVLFKQLTAQNVKLIQSIIEFALIPLVLILCPWLISPSKSHIQYILSFFINTALQIGTNIVIVGIDYLIYRYTHTMKKKPTLQDFLFNMIKANSQSLFLYNNNSEHEFVVIYFLYQSIIHIFCTLLLNLTTTGTINVEWTKQRSDSVIIKTTQYYYDGYEMKEVPKTQKQVKFYANIKSKNKHPYLILLIMTIIGILLYAVNPHNYKATIRSVYFISQCAAIVLQSLDCCTNFLYTYKLVDYIRKKTKPNIIDFIPISIFCQIINPPIVNIYLKDRGKSLSFKALSGSFGEYIQLENLEIQYFMSMIVCFITYWLI